MGTQADALPMGVLRHQLPVHSPLPLRALVPAFRALTQTTTDPREALAAALRARFGAAHCVLCGSGTEALRLAIETALRLRSGASRIALPAFSCYDVAAAAVATDSRLLLYDLDPATLGPDPDSLERALQRGADIVVIAPLYGMPVEWTAVQEQAERYGALLIEDAAQGSGALWRGQPLGSLGDLAVISFGRGKGWTGGRGGALLLRDGEGARVEGAAALREELSTVLVSAVQALLGRPGVYRIPVSIPWLRLGETVYHEAAAVSPMPRVAATILQRTRGAAEAEVGRRREHAGAMLAALHPRPGVDPVAAVAGATPGFLRLPVRLARGIHGFADPAAALRLGIAPSYPTTLAALPAVRARLVDPVRCAGAEELARTLVTLPTHSLVRMPEREAAVRMVNRYPA